MRLFVIRHGETTGDVEDRYGGAYDDHLSATGIEQTEQLVAELKSESITRIYRSPMIRTTEVASALQHGLQAEVEEVPDLRERDQYGYLTGMVKAEARARYPEVVEALKDRLFTAEGGETYEAFAARIEQAFQYVVAEQDACAAIVWHGGPMRVLFRHILALGELKHIGDCSWVELVSDGSTFKIGRYQRIEFEFKV